MDDFAKEVRERWKDADEADRDNREEALYDLEFAAGEQWDERVREYRESGDRDFPLPCLTINQIPQFIGQVVGDRRANQTSIKVLPREDGDKEVAEVRSELIRSIEHQSKADRIYTQAFEQAVTCGIGNFRVDLDYAYEDVFDRDLFVRGIPNPLAVNWDPMAADPTGRDAGWCFVTERMKPEEYKRRFPGAAQPSMFDPEPFTGSWNNARELEWADSNSVRIAEYWTMFEREREIALFADGSVQDVTERADDYNMLLWRGPDGEPRVRKSKFRYASMVITNGQEELTDPFELKIPRLPIIRVMGREVWVGDRRVRFGLARFARDPQRLKNYWRSVVAELLMGAPRANYIAQAQAIRNRENDWPNTLIYNDNTEMPQTITQQNLAAFVNEAAMCAQDMKDVTGLHDASLGMKGNETSGVAIQRRQNEGDIATIGYHDNMNAAMQEAGELLNAMLPITHDTARTARLIGEDNSVRFVRLNDPNDPESIDLSKGRYDTIITTGPTYQTKRQEGAAQMSDIARNNQKVMDLAGDIIFKALDVPLADEISERLKPQGAGDPEDMSEEDQARAQQAAQMQQMMQQMEFKGAQAEIDKKVEDARKAKANADEAEATAELKRLEIAEKRTEISLIGASLASQAAQEEELFNG